MPAGSKYWVFTTNNPRHQITEEDLSFHGVKFCIWSEEVSNSGTHHFQGYLELDKRTVLNRLKKIPGFERARFDRRRGTQAQAIAYSSKTDDETFIDGPYKYGVPFGSNQGRRNDIIAMQRDIDAGYSLAYIARNHFSLFLRYQRSIREYIRITRPDIEVPLYKDFNVPFIAKNKLRERAFLLWGDSGLGKTEYALSHFDNPLFVRHMDHLLRLVEGVHDGIVFDELSFQHFPADSRKVLLDSRRVAQVHVRYDYAVIPANMPRIFTSNRPNIFYGDHDTEYDRNAIDRRLIVLEIKDKLYDEEIGVVPATTSPPNSPLLFQSQDTIPVIQSVAPIVIDLTCDEDDLAVVPGISPKSEKSEPNNDDTEPEQQLADLAPTPNEALEYRSYHSSDSEYSTDYPLSQLFSDEI